MKSKKLFFSLVLLSSLLISCDVTSLPGESSLPSEEASESETSTSNEQSEHSEQSESTSTEPLDTYFVAFWLDTSSSDPYAEFELAEGTPISFPANPTHESFTFDGWYLESARAPFEEYTPIYEDTDLYAKWVGEAATDGKYQIVGELENSNLDEINWDTTSEQSFFAISGPGEYYLEIELGYGAEFKIRETAMSWDGLVLGYEDINDNDRTNHLSEGEFGNIKIESAGTYYIEIIPSEEYLFIEIISSDVSNGVTLENAPSVSALRLIGDLADVNSLVTWDIAPYDESSLFLTTDSVTFYTNEITINEGGAFKVKEPGLDWDEGLELNYGNIWHSDRRGFVSRGENNNVLINEDGVYIIVVTVNRLVPRLLITKI